MIALLLITGFHKERGDVGGRGGDEEVVAQLGRSEFLLRGEKLLPRLLYHRVSVCEVLALTG